MDVVQVLLKNHASTTIQTSDGLTPLHHACIKGNARAVEILINYNVQIFEPTKEGLVCAHLCAKYGHNALLNKVCVVVPINSVGYILTCVYFNLPHKHLLFLV